jgi:hypothetical protein
MGPQARALWREHACSPSCRRAIEQRSGVKLKKRAGKLQPMMLLMALMCCSRAGGPLRSFRFRLLFPLQDEVS